MTEPEAEKLLREARLRVTRPRLAVLSAIHERPHRDAGAIVDTVRDRIGSVSTQTVYGVLNVLVEAQLARRIDLPGSAALYEGQTGDGHQHAVCRSCGGITDIEFPDAGFESTPPAHSTDRGFAIDAVEVTYWGLCPECQMAGLTAGAKAD